MTVLSPVVLSVRYRSRITLSGSPSRRNRIPASGMSSALLPSESEYFKCFGLTEDKLKIAKPDAIVMHPGPINRGVEIDSKVADGPQSVILKQVSNGIAIRMAIMVMTMQKQGVM